MQGPAAAPHRRRGWSNAMNIFEFRDQLIRDYAAYTRSFIQIRDDDIRDFVWAQLESGVLWPDPLSIWIESTFGVQPEPGGQRIVRAQPRSIAGPRGAAAELSELTGVPAERCAEAIRQGLQAKYQTGSPPGEKSLFAFRLHQFISRGDTVYASLESPESRFITTSGQQFVPGDRVKLLPVPSGG